MPPVARQKSLTAVVTPDETNVCWKTYVCEQNDLPRKRLKGKMLSFDADGGHSNCVISQLKISDLSRQIDKIAEAIFFGVIMHSIPAVQIYYHLE